MKKLYCISIIGFVLIVAFWILGYYFAELQCESQEFICRGDETDSINRLNVVYVSLGALFTAMAFGGAILSIIYQRITTLRATSLEVFTRVYNTMQNEHKFKEILHYIIDVYSKQEEHSKSIEELKKEKVFWFRDNVSQETSRYNAILYFCERMDYIGILIKQKYVDITLLYPTGGEYIKAFNILNKYYFTDKDKKRYIHFRHLIYWIQKRSKKYNTYIEQIERKIAKFEKQENKPSFFSKFFKHSCVTCANYEHKDNL